MNRKTLKLVGVLVAAVMLLGMMSFGASAATTDQLTIQGTTITDLGSPHNGAGASGTYAWDPATDTLTLTNFHTEEPLIIASDRNVTIAYVGDCELSSAAHDLIKLSGAGSFTLKGSGGTFALTTTSYYNGITTSADLTLDGGTYDFNNWYSAISCTDCDVTIGNGTVMNAKTKYSAILSLTGNVSITGENTVLTTETMYQSIVCQDLTINGATVTVLPRPETTWTDSILQTDGAITITNATVNTRCLDPENPNQKSGGIYAGKKMTVNSGSTLNISCANESLFANSGAEFRDCVLNFESSEATALFAKGDVLFHNVTGSILSDGTTGGNSVWAKTGNLTISGENTDLKFHSKAPLTADKVLFITEGNVEVLTESGVCLYGKEKIDISGGTLNAKTNGRQTAIYSNTGDISITGDADVTAESTHDSVIFTRDGHVHLASKNITLIPAEGFAPVVARMMGGAEPEGAPEVRVTLGEEIEIPGNKFVTTVWMEAGDGTYYAQTVLVPEDTELTKEGFLEDLGKASVGTLTPSYKPADYTAVDAAIADASVFDPELYSDFTPVTDAIAAVVRGKNITEQAEVDAMAKAITDAIEGLTVKKADYTAVDEAIRAAEALDKASFVDFTAVEQAIAAVVRDKNITEQAEVDAMAKAITDAIAALEMTPEPEIPEIPQTGEQVAVLCWTVLVALSAAGAAVLVFGRKKTSRR